MRNYAYPSSTLTRPIDLIPHILAAVMGGLAIFTMLLAGTAIGFNMYYAGRVYPGVTVAGVDLSGLRPEEAATVIEARLDYPARGRILLRDGENMWLATPNQVGFYLDPQATALSAYRLGRGGNPLARLLAQFESWYLGASLPPLYVFDERAAQNFLTGIAAQNDIPTVDASLTVEGTNVVVRPGQVGRTVDFLATIEGLKTQLQNLRDGEVKLIITESPPAILNVDEQAEIARRILSQPLTITLPGSEEGDPGPWTFDPEALAKMLTIQRVSAPDGDHYQVGLQADGLRSFLEGIAPKLVRYREDARFIFNDDSRQLEVIEPAVVGRGLDVDATIQAINDRLFAGEHAISLDMEYTQPDVGDDATAEQLGITELVSSHTSYFYGSSTERIQNIATASERFHGLLVPPGATFSMADALGDVSLDNGYAEALIIFGNRTIQGVGGGVCQVSTTLFRTAFFGGFPIVERYPHAYRVYYYEQTPSGGNDSDLAGLDATVYAPLVDFKFTNDTSNWLLMETYVNAAGRSLTWKFYSTSDGRKVDWETSGLKNKEDPPKPLYEENPDLDKGEIKQVDWEVEGADVTVTRTVRRDGELLYEDTFATHYLPWRAVYQYGPGTKDMPPKDKKKDN
ncbi:MAG TPA: VanW family protein [Anaerolineales bacterium]|nr:VanW family protein [Anaerolineales bacterium]